MESFVSEVLFDKSDYKVTIADEAGTMESKVKVNVNPEIEKWSDMNHVVRILGRALLEAKAIDFGPENSKLTDTVKDYICYSFSIALSKNKSNSQAMKTVITSIVPHAFGEHQNCGI